MYTIKKNNIFLLRAYVVVGVVVDALCFDSTEKIMPIGMHIIGSVIFNALDPREEEEEEGEDKQ